MGVGELPKLAVGTISMRLIDYFSQLIDLIAQFLSIFIALLIV